VAAAAGVAVWRLWRKASRGQRLFLATLPVAGILSLVVSWLLLDTGKWIIAGQYQPGRYLLYVTFVAVFASAVAGIRAAEARQYPIAAAFLFVAFAIPMHPDITKLTSTQYGLALALAIAGSLPRMALPAAALAFVLLPTAGNVRTAPALHTPELDALAEWARNATPADSVFQFADVRRGLEPGVFRARALRAIYADWKAGGQSNFLPGFAAEWWRRWQQVDRPQPLARYGSLGIDYVVFSAGKQPDGAVAEYRNDRWVVVKTR
jgi:hypothetical protein